jgi:hypothetical protein
MPPIEGNFNETLDLLWGGQGVAARGPLIWGDEGTSATLNVVIMQDNTGAMASGRTGGDVPFGANEFLVAAAVEGDAPLKPGPALATGLALVHGNTVDMYQWSDRVTLKEGPPPAKLAEHRSPAKKVGTPA